MKKDYTPRKGHRIEEGPFHVGEHSDYGWRILTEQDSVCANVFQLYTAQKMAAAPDMLDAIDDLLATLRRWRDKKPDFWYAIVDSGMATAWDKARAAQNKARGEEHAN